LPGSRLARRPKAEATELAPEAVGASPPERLNRAEGFSCKDDLLLMVKFPSGGFGRFNAKFAGLPALKMSFHLSLPSASRVEE
jgi:hypothetical protein